jgi:hypothetical protein
MDIDVSVLARRLDEAAKEAQDRANLTSVTGGKKRGELQDETAYLLRVLAAAVRSSIR